MQGALRRREGSFQRAGNYEGTILVESRNGAISSPWPALLIGIVAVNFFLSLALKQGSLLAAFSKISYFLLLLLATGFAIDNAIKNRLGSRPFWVFLGNRRWPLGA